MLDRPRGLVTSKKEPAKLKKGVLVTETEMSGWEYEPQVILQVAKVTFFIPSNLLTSWLRISKAISKDWASVPKAWLSLL